MTHDYPSPQGEDDFLLGDGLPCLRRDGKLYYLTDVQPRVLEACRQFEISFDQLAEKLGMTRPVLLLILKGYDPVSPVLKSMLDRLVAQSTQPPGEKAEPAPSPVVTRIESVPVPPAREEDAPEDDADPVITLVPEAIDADMRVPQPLSPGRPAVAVPPVTPSTYPGPAGIYPRPAPRPTPARPPAGRLNRQNHS